MPAPKGNKNALGNKGGGRVSSFKKEYVAMAERVALLGATDAQLADVFEVSETTINAWKRGHVEFAAALKKGKMAADGHVAERLYKRAMGYSHKAEKIFCQDGEITRAKYTEHYPPDTTACIFWLKNRRPDLFRDRMEALITAPPPDPEAEARRLQALAFFGAEIERRARLGLPGLFSGQGALPKSDPVQQPPIDVTPKKTNGSGNGHG